MDSDTIAVKAASEVETSAEAETALRKRGEASEEPSPSGKGMAATGLDGGGGEKTSARPRRLRGRPTGITKNRPTTLRMEASTGREDMATLMSMITSLQDLVIQQEETIREVQKELKEQRTEHKTANQERRTNHQEHSTELKVMKAIMQDTTVRQPMYSEMAARGTQPTKNPSYQASKADNTRFSGSPTGGTRTQRQRDERAVTINVAGAKVEKTDYTKIRTALQQGLDKHKVTEGLRITCLGPGPAERIDVIFETEAQADKARGHKQWVTSSVPGTRIQEAQWSPIKLDGVPKAGILQDDGRTLVNDSGATFAKDNSTHEIDSTVMRAPWLSRPDPLRKLGSLVIWLKSESTAQALLRCGSAMLGAVGVYCSKYESRNATLPCFNCGDYRHKQASCKNTKRCAICSKGHDWRSCTNQSAPKYPSCQGSHSAFDWCRAHHPKHRGFLAKQKADRKTEDPTQTSTTAPAAAAPLKTNPPKAGPVQSSLTKMISPAPVPGAPVTFRLPTAKTTRPKATPATARESVEVNMTDAPSSDTRF